MDRNSSETGTSEPRFSTLVPDGDTSERSVCDACGFIDYVNPKIVVGSVISHNSKIVMCKRAIEPRLGFWTIPAGYLEVNETTEDGARREALEEACANISITALLAVYNIARISQVQLIYTAELKVPTIAAGPESLEVAFVEWDDIPWKDLAFPSVHWALNHYQEVKKRPFLAPFSNPENETGNVLPNK